MAERIVTKTSELFGILRRRWHYTRYRWAQIRQTRAKRDKDASFRLRPFAELVRRICMNLTATSSVLSIGPRNDIELTILEEKGLGRVTALDLWSGSPRIRRGDMHWMAFPDDAFDLIFASHVFEHAYDFSKVAAECIRVLRPEGYVFCAVPTNFQPNDHDRTHFRSADEILAHFADADPRVLHVETRPTELVLLLRLRKGRS